MSHQKDKVIIGPSILLKDASVMTGTRTHTLMIRNHQNFNMWPALWKWVRCWQFKKSSYMHGWILERTQQQQLFGICLSFGVCRVAELLPF